MVIAYIRVSTEKQDLENQQKEIERYALKKGIRIDRWEKETVSGTVSRKNRLLERVINSLQKDDTLIITEISRLSRSLLEILSTMQECIKRGINVYSVKDGYSFDDSINSTVLIFAFGLVSEIERKLISMRTREALISKRNEGKILGRPQGASPQLQKLISKSDEIKKRLDAGESIESICTKAGVSRSTFDRFKKKNL